MAALRSITRRMCMQCGGPMKGIKLRRYCCDACRFKAYRARKALLEAQGTIKPTSSFGGQAKG